MIHSPRSPRVQTKKKWRPSLALIIFAVLAGVMAIPLVGFIFFRLYENQLINQTESELIAQGAVLSAVYAQEFKKKRTPETKVGHLRAKHLHPDPKEPYHPILPSLDITQNPVLPRRPRAQQAKIGTDPLYAHIGEKLFKITHETQKITLAGFRILDHTGTVIGGKYEMGLSLAHVYEVTKALNGEYAVVLRERLSDEPAPPLYSISRGTKIRIFIAMPVFVDHNVIGVIYLARTPNNIIKHLYAHQRKVITVALTLIALMLIIGFIFWRTIAGPLYALIKRTAEIGKGNRQAIKPLDRHGTMEVAQLSQSFLNMAQNLVDRADYISTFAAHVSHELKSPLTSIQGAAELLQDSGETMTEEEKNRFLNNIITDTVRLTTLLSRLRELAKADNPQIGGKTSLHALTQGLIDSFGNKVIKTYSLPETNLQISLENVHIIFSHLIDNAQQHKASQISIEAEKKGSLCYLTISDNGSGISPQNREKIFQAFFTTRRETGGTGMGLGIVNALLEAHNGTITLLPSLKGAKFMITIPCSELK